MISVKKNCKNKITIYFEFTEKKKNAKILCSPKMIFKGKAK